MPNYAISTTARFEPFSLQELYLPIKEASERYYKDLETLTDRQAEASIWDNMLTEEEKQLYPEYNNYMEKVNNAVNRMMTEGNLNPDVLQEMYALKGEYNKVMKPLEVAYAELKQRRATQDKDGDSKIRNVDAYDLNVIDVLRGKMGADKTIDVNSLYNKAKDAFGALSGILNRYGQGHKIDDYHKSFLKSYGINPSDISKMSNNEIFAKVFNGLKESTGVTDWNNIDAEARVDALLEAAGANAIGKSDVQLYQDPEAVYHLQHSGDGSNKRPPISLNTSYPTGKKDSAVKTDSQQETLLDTTSMDAAGNISNATLLEKEEALNSALRKARGSKTRGPLQGELSSFMSHVGLDLQGNSSEETAANMWEFMDALNTYLKNNADATVKEAVVQGYMPRNIQATKTKMPPFVFKDKEIDLSDLYKNYKGRKELTDITEKYLDAMETAAFINDLNYKLDLLFPENRIGGLEILKRLEHTYDSERETTYSLSYNTSADEKNLKQKLSNQIIDNNNAVRLVNASNNKNISAEEARALLTKDGTSISVKRTSSGIPRIVINNASDKNSYEFKGNETLDIILGRIEALNKKLYDWNNIEEIGNSLYNNTIIPVRTGDGKDTGYFIQVKKDEETGDILKLIYTRDGSYLGYTSMADDATGGIAKTKLLGALTAKELEYFFNM